MIKHRFVSSKGDPADTTLIKPSDWNAEHTDGVYELFGDPDTAYEFNTSSLSGLTAMGTVQADDANTTIPGHYYVRNNSNASPYWRGRSLSISPPFTAIVKLSTNPSRNYEGAGIMFGESTIMSSGQFDVISLGVGTADRQVGAFHWTGPGTFSATIATSPINVYHPAYLAIKIAASNNTSAYWSFDGRVWFPLFEARDSGFTVAKIAIASAAQNTTGFIAAYDYLRIWNSSKTFPS